MAEVPDFVRAAVGGGLVLAMLSGCGVVGNGEKPERLYLGVTEKEAAATITECTTKQLNAIVVFTGDNEQIGTFNTRVTWASQNPSIVFVSDGVTPSPAGTVYPAGMLVALRPGTATISSDYLGLQASITVDVSELTGLQVKAGYAITATSAVTTDLTDIAEQLTQQFQLKAVLTEGGPETYLTTSAAWRFDPATVDAYVDAGTGLVHANSASDGQTVNLVARLPECDREVSTSFRVSPIASLTAQYELGEQTQLPIGFSDAMRVMAGFADASAPLQNVTTQMTVDTIDDDYVSEVIGADAYYVAGLNREGSGAMTLKLSVQPQALTVTSKTWQVKNTALTSFTLTPDDLRITYPDTGQLQAIGTFDDGLVMPITRHVAWTTSASALATVSAVFSTAGEIVITNTDGDADIGATITSTNGDALDETVTIHDFANQYADEPTQ